MKSKPSPQTLLGEGFAFEVAMYFDDEMLRCSRKCIAHVCV